MRVERGTAVLTRTSPAELAPAPDVTAETLTAAVRAHVDQVHDLVRRQGLPAAVAPAAVEAGALAAVDRAAHAGGSLPMLLGHWCAAACAHPAASPLTGDPAAALGRCDPDARTALLLTDAYGLPPETLATALDLDLSSAQELLGRARLDLLGTPLPPAHLGAGALAVLASTDDGAADRHVRGCPACSRSLAAQQGARRQLTALPLLGLPEQGREALLERVAVRARVLLPARALPPAPARRRVLAPLPVALGLLLAVLLGVGLGALLSSPATPAQARARTLPAVTAPPATPLPGDTPLPAPPAPSTVVFTYLPAAPVHRPQVPTPAPTTPAPAPSPTVTPRPVTLTLDPTVGPTGTTVRVTGTGWTPGSSVNVVVVDPDGQRTATTATAVAGRLGRITVSLTVTGPPGSYQVVASDGLRTASAVLVLR